MSSRLPSFHISKIHTDFLYNNALPEAQTTRRDLESILAFGSEFHWSSKLAELIDRRVGKRVVS